MRRSINDGIITALTTSIDLFTEHSKLLLTECKGDEKKASELARIMLAVGRHSCQRYSPDAIILIMQKVTELTKYCNEYPRIYRKAADVFNETTADSIFVQ